MCGIHLLVEASQSCLNHLDQRASLVARRGPDALGCQVVEIDHGRKVHLTASVLQMRATLVEQPVAISVAFDDKKSTSFFAWNGEIYQMADGIFEGELSLGQDEPVIREVWQYHNSDTAIMANHIKRIMAQRGPKDFEDGLIELFSSLVNAEYAFVLLCEDVVYFGRDPWGRRSLLKHVCPACGSVQIASVLGDDAVQKIFDSEVQQDTMKGIVEEIKPGVLHSYRVVENSFQQRPFATLSLPKESLPDLLPSPAPSGISDSMWRASFLLEYLLEQAVERRLDVSGKRPTAVLFSGGLDSVVLAALALRVQANGAGLHLYNVSFGPDHEKSADRQAALISYEALLKLFPEKDVTYRDIVTQWEDIRHHEPHIRRLLWPKSTIMDLNIATALWFASRGPHPPEGQQQPTVLILGMGADEQLGGYGRHRKAYTRGGWEGLHRELQMDKSRFWDRNLGRDDRICADHGKEARFPFLDTNVVNLLKEMPLENICNFDLPPGRGDKLILRLVAERLGLSHAGGLVKRAIQFGSRVAHVGDARRFGGSRRRAKGESNAPTSGVV